MTMTKSMVVKKKKKNSSHFHYIIQISYWILHTIKIYRFYVALKYYLHFFVFANDLKQAINYEKMNNFLIHSRSANFTNPKCSYVWSLYQRYQLLEKK